MGKSLALLLCVSLSLCYGFHESVLGRRSASKKNRRRLLERVYASVAVESLMKEGNVASIIDEVAELTAQVRSGAAGVLPGEAGEARSACARTWLLRFASSSDGDGADAETLAKAVEASIAWRLGEGLKISEAACEAYALATAQANAWDNEPVLSRAPHSKKIGPYFTPAKLLTLRNARNDGLIYAIRAGQIDDKKLMAEVSADDLTDFFLYAKAVNERAAHDIARKTGVLATVVTCNDLSGVDLFGDTRFRNALSRASKKADAIYPGLAAETILFNLPAFLRALVNIFKPLFPPSVQQKLKFATFAFRDNNDSQDKSFLDRASPIRAEFLNHVDRLTGGGGK